jgi:YHS domain-containing protein
MDRSRPTSFPFAARLLLAGLVTGLVALGGGLQTTAQAADASVAEASAADSILEQVEAPYVCMITNKVFDSKQIEVPVEGHVYYGCCQMCVKKLNNNPESRYATDPVSGAQVNKAEAVLGAGPDEAVRYFESVETLRAFNATAQKKGE